MTDKHQPEAVRPPTDEVTPSSANDVGLQGTSRPQVRRAEPSTSRGSPVPSSPPAPRGSSVSIQLSPSAAQLSSDKTVISQRAPFGGPALRDAGTGDDPRVALAGRQLLHFQLEEFIGGGGMGLVFRGTDLELGRPVAVKVLIPQIGTDEETVRRFRQEAQSAARLNHKNIAQVYYVGEVEGWNFIAFEFAEGENVRDAVLRQGQMPIRLAVEYVMQIAVALEHAYHRGVIHRDIKPSNIVITPDGQAKLVDMGLARLSRVESGYDDLTASGVTLGTFDYISPEQGRDPRSADIRSDLYSLGCTLYFMLTGRPPFPDGTVLQKLLHHTNDRVSDPRNFRPDIPPELVQIVMKLLAKSPRRRFQHPRDLYVDLLRLAERHGLTVAANPDSGVARALTGARRQQRLRGGLILVPMAIVGGLAFLADAMPSSQHAISEVIPAYQVAPATIHAPDKSSSEPGGPIGEGNVNSPNDTPIRPREDREVPEPEGETPNNPSVKPFENGPPKLSDSAAVPTPGSGSSNTGGPIADGLTKAADLAEASRQTRPPADDGMPESLPGDIRATDPMSDADREPFDRQGLRHVIVGSALREGGPMPPVPPDVAYVDTLSQAISLAEQHRDLQTIELEFNGPRLVRPLSMNNIDVTIRAAKGYAPILQFRPRDTDAETATTRMVTIVGGNVQFVGVHFDLRVPVVPALNWAMFGIDNVQLVKFQDSWMTITSEGPLADYYSDVSVIDVLPSGSVSMTQSSPGTTSLQEVVLQDCVVRGVARLIHCSSAQPLRLAWSNGLLATNEHLITIGGSPIPARHGENVQVNLDHVTAVVDAGLCKMTNDVTNPHWLPLVLNCTHSILLTLPDSPLIEQIAASMPLDQFDAYLEYTGQRNFYERVTVFWSKLVREADLPEAREEVLTFDKWQQRWGKADKLGQWDRVNWQRRFPDAFPRYQVLPEHFAISSQPGNPARGVAADGRDAGLDLPNLPPDPYPAHDAD